MALLPDVVNQRLAAIPDKRVGREIRAALEVLFSNLSAAELAFLDGATSANTGTSKAAILGTSGALALGGTATVPAIAGSDASLGVDGLAAAQGGAVVITGGTSATAGNAGGASSLVGGTPGSTGIGGAANVTGSAGGSASGKGGAVNLTGGSGTAGNGHGGSIVMQPGAKHGSGLDGGTFNRGTTQFRKQAAPGAGTDQNETLTAAQMINGIYVHTIAQARTLTTPTGAAISAGCPTDLAVGDSFDFTVITVGTGADDISTLTAGDGNVTFVGKVTVGPDTAPIAAYGTWRFRNTGADTWVGYRVG